MTAPEQRCVIDGLPIADHIALRYVWRAWYRHRLLQLRALLRGRL